MASLRIYLHIGFPKTGTTSIQEFCYQNASSLLAQGILFPQSPGVDNHKKLVVYAQDDEKIDDQRKIYLRGGRIPLSEFRATFEADFLREVAEANPKVILLSNEHCSLRLKHLDELYRLKKLLNMLTDDIKIVVYLREQSEALLSSYSTGLKSGSAKELGVPKKKPPRFDYWKSLKRWNQVFGSENLTVRVFDRSSLINGDVIEDFLQCINLQDQPEFEAVTASNQSLDVYTAEFLRQFNRYVPRFNEDTYKKHAQRGRIITLLEAFSTGPKLNIDQETKRQFSQLFAADNQKIAKTYLNKSDGVLFPENDQSPEECNFPAEGLSLEKAIEIAAYLWVGQQNEISYLEAEIKRLQAQQ